MGGRLAAAVAATLYVLKEEVATSHTQLSSTDPGYAYV